VQDALACADALRAAFAEIVREAVGNASVQAPTLSVGIGIGHVLQSLGRLLALGRDAERHAKRADRGQRNTLAVMHERHSGTVRTWHASWEDDPLGQIEHALGLLEGGRLSAKKIHQVHDLLRHAPAEERPEDGERWRRLLQAEVPRILARTDLGRADGQPLDLDDAGICFGDSYAADREQLDRWISGMQIAIEIMRARQSVEKRS
jgi:CRISPR-associated protein Cmr2